MMQRLPFRLKDFVRELWVSDEAQQNWLPRIERIRHAWRETEWLSIVDGIRAAALMSFCPADLETFRVKCGLHGLEIAVLSRVSMASTYSSSLQTPQDDQPASYWCVVGSQSTCTAVQESFARSDDNTIGRLLGYPACCIEFFARVWNRERWIDTTWAMAQNTETAKHSGHVVEVTHTKRASAIFRWIGIRNVPHLPCSFDCQASDQLAAHLYECAVNHGFAQEVGWLTEMAGWPFEWSALHGIAEIRTPVVKIATSTDATAEKLSVRSLGTVYPAEAPQALYFPYRPNTSPPLALSKGFQQGLSNSLSTDVYAHLNTPLWYHLDNGFATRYAMDASHRLLVNTATAFLSERQEITSIFDFGCGNGALVHRISKIADIECRGVDFSPEKVSHATELCSEMNAQFFCEDMFDRLARTPEQAENTLALIMIGRLYETDRAACVESIQHLSRFGAVMIYAYTDYCRQVAAFDKLAQTVGLSVEKHFEDAYVQGAFVRNGHVTVAGAMSGGAEA